MKTLSSAFRASASGDTNAPLELYDLYLDGGTLRFVNYDKNISFYDVVDGSSQTYIALPIAREVYERTVENPINSIVLGIANVDRAISAWLAIQEFRGRRVIIRKVFADQLTTSGDTAIIFDGVMDCPKASEEAVQINAVDRIGTLNREAPRRWYQILCNWKYMDEFCGFGRASGDMYATVNGIVSGDSTNVIIKSANLAGYSNDYFKDGEVQVTSGQSALKKRKVLLSSGDTVNLIKLSFSLPYAPASGDTFTLRRGCDKTHFRCSGDFQNDANFGGFDTIPLEMIIE